MRRSPNEPPPAGPPPFGPTGYPDLPPEAAPPGDKGGLDALAYVDPEKGLIIMAFGTTINMLALDVEGARAMIVQMTELADQLERHLQGQAPSPGAHD